MRVPFLSLGVVCVVVVAACATGGDSGPGGPSGDDGGAGDAPTADGLNGDALPEAGKDSASVTSASKACADDASAYCNQLTMCSAFLLHLEYGDAPTCVTRRTASCADLLAAPGTGWTGDALEACVTARNALGCDAFLDGKPAPNACRVTGQIITSDPCRYDGQCGSGYCRYATGAACGNCVTLGATGAPCTASSDCDGNLVCTSGTSGTCQPPTGLGGSCSATTPCQQGLGCIAANCVQPGMIGATCDPKNASADCDYDQGVYCDSTSKACKAYVVEAAGSPCGGLPAICAAGGTCFASGSSSTCVAPAKDGATCSAATGVGCLTPATCTSGTCGLYAAAQCK